MFLLPGNAVNLAAPLNRGLVSWWLHLPNRLGGGGNTLRDLVGRNHGTLTNGPTWSGSRGRGAFGSINYDGSNDYVDCGTCPNLDFGSNNFTIAARYYLTTLTGTLGLISKRDTFANMAWEFFWSAGSTWRFGFGNALSTDITFSASTTANAWHHIALTRVGSTFTCYINGVQAGSTGSSAASVPSTGNVRIGVLAGDAIGSFHWPGYIDDVRIYPSRGLTASEVSTLNLASLRGYQNELNWQRYPVYGPEQAAVTSVVPYYHLFGGVT